MCMETRELLLRKAEFDDWKAMYRNVWSRPETARYMAWQVTTDEEQAKVRIRKTISHQENHDAFLVCEEVWPGHRFCLSIGGREDRLAGWGALSAGGLL